MRTTVLGAGTMGHGIGQVMAMAGNEVVLYDIDSDIVEEGIDQIEQTLTEGVELGKVSEMTRTETLSRISGTTSFEEATTDSELVIEAVPEEIELKQDTLQRAQEHAGPDAIMASNTSSISITEMARALDYPEQLIGLHFWNPVHLISFVEIPVGAETSDEVFETVVDLVEDDLEFEYAVIHNDYPGFASSRLGVALGVEAMRMVEEGVASPDAIDRVMTSGYGYSIGPLEQTDLAGLDIRLNILEYLREHHGERFRPPQILRQKVHAGEVGEKAGEGFYVWDNDEIVDVSVDRT